MHFPEEPGNVKPSDTLHQWARLEGKSDSMAEELIQNVHLKKGSSKKAGRNTNALVFGVLMTLCIGVTFAILWSKGPSEPPETSLSISSDVRQLGP
jgi:hypothetical protein